MSYKVFMADSSSPAIKAVHMAFQDTGVDFYSLQEGSQVMDIVQKVHPDAIILALSLPNKDGYEIAFDLARDDEFKEIPLLFLQGIFEDIDEDRIKDFKHAEIIQKPFDSEELVSVVQNLMGQALDPDTLPEEPGDVHSGDQEEREEISDSNSMPDLEKRIKRQVKQEILDLERELEKRIVSRIRAEMPAGLSNNSTELKKGNSHSEDS